MEACNQEELTATFQRKNNITKVLDGDWDGTNHALILTRESPSQLSAISPQIIPRLLSVTVRMGAVLPRFNWHTEVDPAVVTVPASLLRILERKIEVMMVMREVNGELLKIPL